MRLRRSQQGFLLIVAVILIAVAATMAAVIVTLTAGSSGAGGLHLNSTQALFAAESGIDHATRLLKTGTTCGNLNVTIGTVTVDTSTYTVTGTSYPTGASTTLTAAVNAGDTTIPVNDTASYADHGRIRINGEDLLYSGKTTTSFTGVLRGYAATTIPATHAAGSTVNQDLCLIRSVGTSGSAVRTLELGIQPGPWSAIVDGAITPLPNNVFTQVANVAPSLPAGDNLVIATVTLQNTAIGGGQRTTFSGDVSTPAGVPGLLLLARNNAVAIDWNEYDIVVGDGNIDANDRPEKTFFLIARDTGRPAGDSYQVYALPNNNNTIGEAKIIVISNPPVSAFAFGTTNNLAVDASVVDLATGFDAGTNVVIAWVQFDNQAGGGGDRTIAAGNLRLRRTTAPATDLFTNEYDIELRRNGNPNEQTAVLLIGLDVNAPANPNYQVSAQASGGNVRAASNIIAIQGLGADFIEGPSSAIGVAATTLATLATTFPALYPARSNLVITSSQYENGVNTTPRDVEPNQEAIVFNAVNRAVNEFRYRMCRSGLDECRHFSSAALLWRHSSAGLNPAANPTISPTYSVNSAASVAGSIDGEAKILGIHLDPLTERREVFP